MNSVVEAGFDSSAVPVGSVEAYGDPFFIFGAPRSGTSLLSRMMNGHPAIGVPFESLLYTSLFDRRHFYGDLSLEANRARLVKDCLRTYPMQLWTPVPMVEDVLTLYTRPDFHGAVEAIMRSWLRTQGKRRWGEKSPWHLYYWQHIIEAFPNSKIVHIVRDGRDSVLSWKAARFGPRHVYPLAKKWANYIETMSELREEVGTDRVHELRYEDLLESPEHVLRGVCEFLGEDYSDEMLAFHENKDPYPTDAVNNSNLTRPVIRSNQQKWRTLMSARELRLFESVAADQLERYQYERSDPAARIGTMERMRVTYLEHPLSRVYGILKNGQGLREAIRLWTIYLELYFWRSRRPLDNQSER